MRIAIVDDLAGERLLLRGRLEQQFMRRGIPANLFEYESGEAFLAAAKSEPFTVAFLDIYMDGINGIEAAEQLRTFDTDCLLIMTTTSVDHALEGFRVRAMHYLVKPYDEEEVDKLTDEILRRIPVPNKFIDIKVSGGTVRLCLCDILYAEHYAHMIDIKTADGKTLSTRQSFGEFTALLKEDERFFVCSRGVVVNLEHVEDFDGTIFIMDNKSKVSVSRDLQKSARQTLMEYLFKRGHT